MSGKRSFFDPNGPHRREKITGQKTKWKMIERKGKNDDPFFHAFLFSFNSVVFSDWFTTKSGIFSSTKTKTKAFLELRKKLNV